MTRSAFRNVFASADANPRSEVEIYFTAREREAFLADLDKVGSDVDFASVLEKHVGKEFTDIAKKYVFGVVVVRGPVIQRWKRLD